MQEVVRENWVEQPLRAYEENARRLFGYPDSTLGEYLRDLRRFLGWLGASGIAAGSGPGSEGVPGSDQIPGTGAVTDTKEDPGTVTRGWPETRLLSVTREEVEGWIVALSGRGLRAATINRKIASLNSFYCWALHHRLVERVPVAGVRKLKTPRRIPKFLTFEDIRTLLTYTGSIRRSSTIRGKQVHAMISILYFLGLRREELVSMRFEHIEKVTDSEIYLHVFGKGDKQRLVPFPEPAFDAYRKYLRYRPESADPHVFISVNTRRPISKYNVNNVCRQLSKRVALSKKLTPHLLRHTFATHLHLKGQPIEHIGALLGHESLDTTKIYVHIDAGRLRHSVEQLFTQEVSG